MKKIIISCLVALLIPVFGFAEDVYVPITGDGEVSDVNEVVIELTEEVTTEQKSRLTLKYLDQYIDELENIIKPAIQTDTDRRVNALQAQIDALNAATPISTAEVDAKIDRAKAIRAKVAEEAAKIDLIQ